MSRWTLKLLFSMRNPRFLISACVLAAIFVGVSGTSARPGTPRGTQGPYKMIFGGAYVGEGRAVVTASNKIAILIGNVTEVATGATGQFRANNLPLDDGHFTGVGTVLGQPVTLCGRAEAADGKIVVVSRIMCSFVTASGAGGRAVGSK